jgi:hypothetical protein
MWDYVGFKCIKVIASTQKKNGPIAHTRLLVGYKEYGHVLDVEFQNPQSIFLVAFCTTYVALRHLFYYEHEYKTLNIMHSCICYIMFRPFVRKLPDKCKKLVQSVYF